MKATNFSVKNIKFFFFVGVLCAFFMGATQAQGSWTSGGPPGGYINGLAIDPTSSDTVFAAIKGEGQHLAKTIDGGASWDYLVDSPTNLSAVTIYPQNPSIIFVGDDSYSYKSTNGGQNWYKQLKSFCETGDIWVNPSDAKHVVVATTSPYERDYGIYWTIDAGGWWHHTVDAWRCLTLAADPNDFNSGDTNGDIYAGTKENGYVIWSPDGGYTWYQFSPGGDWVNEVRDIEVDLNSHVYAATDKGLMKGVGSGSTNWIKLTGLPTDDITALAIDRSTNPGIVYVGTGEDGVFVSQDGGSTWIPVNEGLGNLSITKLAVSASQPIMLYAGTAYGGVWSRPQYCSGYFSDGDGDMDGSDLAVFAAAFGSASGDPNYKPDADFDNNDNVNNGDLAIFAGDFGRTDRPIGFFENFNDGVADNWYDQDEGEWSVADGVYKMTGSSPSQTVCRHSRYNRNFSDFTYRVWVNRIQGALNYETGITFRSDGTWQNGYRFVIAGLPDTGYYSVIKHVEGSRTILADWTMSSAINPGYGVWNTLKIVCNGTALKFYINGTLVESLDDSEFSSGQVGVMAWDLSDGDNTIVHFDDAELVGIK